ncbi:MAG TPA: asparagine synthase-related protein, partial [Thermoplasmata archaeon]|nr:asparagine synthase-related protein [Thermoplasmata archaeon]
ALLAAGALGKEHVRGYVVSVDSATHDLDAARDSARLLGIGLQEVIVSEKEVEDACSELAEVIGTTDLFILSFELPLWFVARDASEREILLGQGADELFGGYSRYQRLAGKDLETELRNDALSLLDVVEREESIAKRFRKEFLYPYLDRGVMEIAMSLPLEEKVGPKGRKYALQEAAIRAGMPEHLARKQKKAAQYGSGTWRALRQGRGAQKRKEE